MEQYHREHGIGQLSSSPASDERLHLELTTGRLYIVRKDDEKQMRDGLQQPQQLQLQLQLQVQQSFTTSDALNSATKSKTKTRISATAKAKAEAQLQSQAPPAASTALQQLSDRKVNSSATTSSPAPGTDAKQNDRQELISPYENDALPHVSQRTAPPDKRSSYSKNKNRKNREKMDDLTSDSPTQSNDGRSYEQYREDYPAAIASSQPKHPLVSSRGDSQVSHPSSSHEPRTLHEDDTGAVKFDWQPLEHDADADADADADHVLSTSQPAPRSQSGIDAATTLGRHSMPPSTMPPPETPVVPARPFSNDASTGNLMGASQLFMLTSGVKKLASPTSSRPSPHVFEHNTISPNNLSSPLRDRGLRTSPLPGLNTSPAPALVPDTSSKPHESECDDKEAENIPQPRRRNRPDPIGNYAPIHKSPPTHHVPDPDPDADQTDSESDESQERRRLARLRQERANRSLTNISLPRKNSRSDKIEVPSTNRRRQKPATQSTASALSTPDSYVEQRYGKPDAADQESQETVADSQEVASKPDLTTAIPPLVPNSAEVVNGDDTTQPDLPSAPVRSNETAGSKETIPETSPPRNPQKGLPQRLAKPSPIVEQRSLRSSQRTTQSVRPSSDETKAIPSSPPVPGIIAASASPSAQSFRRSTRLKVAVTPAPSSAATHVNNHQPPTTSSTLTELTATPRVSSSTTPDTEAADPEPEPNPTSTPAVTSGVVSSPAAAKQLRQKPTKLKTYASPKSRASVRSSKASRRASMSTDDLALSTPTSVSKSRSSRSFARKSTHDTRQLPSSAGIFHDMTFATSFQSEQEKRTVEKMIIAAGGTIVPRGFDELVQVGPLESNQRPGLKNGHGAGFAALITDTHSRKPKYMQALALGLPCLSWKWVASCVKANEILSWSTYLLCAGQSQVLGAIRSRSLDSYGAVDANLEDIIEKRPRLLNDAKVLLVMKKSKREEEKRMQYVFLAQVLGASLVRVSTLEEARSELRKREDMGDAFGWVYVDGQQVDTDKILFGRAQGQAPAASKKRKRQSMTESLDGPPPKKVRTLTDELVVQSLILGRLVEDGEMEDSLV
ncbi:hypothetical protein TruAng_006809 [Truncatella angustata]|nr:hypothetical protein TruAng_006809 [Truncatella angustata]